MPGWSDFFGGIGDVIGKLSTYIPGRIEKLKNERTRIQGEKDEILAHTFTPKSADRLLWINKRLDAINGLLASSAKD